MPVVRVEPAVVERGLAVRAVPAAVRGALAAEAGREPAVRAAVREGPAAEVGREPAVRAVAAAVREGPAAEVGREPVARALWAAVREVLAMRAECGPTVLVGSRLAWAAARRDRADAVSNLVAWLYLHPAHLVYQDLLWTE